MRLTKNQSERTLFTSGHRAETKGNLWRRQNPDDHWIINTTQTKDGQQALVVLVYGPNSVFKGWIAK